MSNGAGILDWLANPKPGRPFCLPTGGVDNIIRLQHKQVVTVVATGDGSFAVAIVPSPMGAVGINNVANVAGIPIAQYGFPTADGPALAAWTAALDRSTAVLYAPPNSAWVWNNNNTNTASGVGGYPIVPYNEWQTGAPWQPISGGGQGAAFMPSAFRIARQAWQMQYTGPSLTASGQLAVCTQRVQREKIIPQNTTTTNSPTSSGVMEIADLEVLGAGVTPQAFPDVAIASGAIVRAVQPGLRIGSVKFPSGYDWTTWNELTTPVVTVPGNTVPASAVPLFAQLIRAQDSSSTSNGSGAWVAGPTPGLGEMPVTFIAGQGLVSDLGGTFILEVITDVEYKVMPTSPVRHFTGPPMADSPQLKQVIAEAAREVPAAVDAPVGGGIVDGIANAVGWYAKTWAGIAGTVWGTGGKVLQQIGLYPKFGETMQGLGALVSGTDRLAIEG